MAHTQSPKSPPVCLWGGFLCHPPCVQETSGYSITDEVGGTFTCSPPPSTTHWVYAYRMQTSKHWASGQSVTITRKLQEPLRATQHIRSPETTKNHTVLANSAVLSPNKRILLFQCPHIVPPLLWPCQSKPDSLKGFVCYLDITFHLTNRQRLKMPSPGKIKGK